MENLVSDCLWGWATVAHVVLDAKVIVGPTRVMTRSQQNTTFFWIQSHGVIEQRTEPDNQGVLPVAFRLRIKLDAAEGQA